MAAFLRHERAWLTAKRGCADSNLELLDIAEGNSHSALYNFCDKSSISLQGGLARTLSDFLDKTRVEIRESLNTNQHNTLPRDFLERSEARKRR
ncbi:hypothetical protein M3J09_001821 [Ascochyta lentis]